MVYKTTPFITHAAKIAAGIQCLSDIELSRTAQIVTKDYKDMRLSI